MWNSRAIAQRVDDSRSEVAEPFGLGRAVAHHVCDRVDTIQDLARAALPHRWSVRAVASPLKESQPRFERRFRAQAGVPSGAPANVAPCATAGCRSRSSRPSSSATTRSPTTSRRARSPIGASPISASTTSTSTTLLLCYGDHLGDPRAARRGRRRRRRDRRRRRARHAGRGGRAVRDRDRRCSNRATTPWSCAPTTRRTSRRRARSAPTLDVVDLAFDERLAARRRSRSRRACAPGVTRLISVTCPHNPTGTMFDSSDAARARRARRTRRARCCSSTRRTAT